MSPHPTAHSVLLDEHAPLALAALHRAHGVGDRLRVRLTRSPAAGSRAAWRVRTDDVLEGAGFALERWHDDTASVVRLRTLSDHVGPAMRVLLCGLNPSPYAADVGIGFARPGNRFWPAALASGLVTLDRDPGHALERHGVGMTDLVKRATARADELTREDYRHGGARLERLVSWLSPGVVCVLGVTGWRAGVDPRATAGWQPGLFGGAPVYVMANPSGLNAHATPASLCAELVEVQRVADAGRRAAGGAAEPGS